MNKENKKPPDRPRRQIPSGQGANWFRYIFWILLIWLIISFFFNRFQDTDRVRVSYTTFKSQVQDSNVASIVIEGQEIKGEFRDAYILPTDTSENPESYQKFVTIKPQIEDPELLKILEAQNVEIEAREEGEGWWQYALILLLPWVIILGLFWYSRRKMQSGMKGMMGQGGIFGVGKSKARRHRQSKSDVTFKDVAGLENAKRDLREIIDFLKEPEKFTKLGADIPKGVLLMGPPGTGKTLLAKATAGEAEVPFYSISGSEFIEMFVGVGASRVRDMFSNAKKESPAIIFIDEIDSVGRARGTGLGGGHDEREQTLNQILNEMDGFESQESVVVLAATNRPDVLDPALTRPGRFDRQITLELPQKKARESILKIHTREVPLHKDVDLENLAARTVGFSGAELENLVNEAALLAGRKERKEVHADDFDSARDKILLGAEREEKIEEDEKKLIAYHEAGHALMANLLPDTDPLQKVTIIPRGRTLGATEQVPETDRHNYQKNYLLNRIAVTLGGRVAEKIVFDDYSNGAANDLKQVTQLARKMICHWGMSEKLGPVYYKQGEEHLFLGREMAQQKDFSEYSAKIIDEEIQRIIAEMEEKSMKTLKANREKLDALAEALMEHETLEREDLEKLLKEKKKNSGKKKKQSKKKS
ncbi:MAG: ATP-dependent metallopeptidase FtsH/Yme1/Tma family protein [Calditrichaeota bacterium]|nr:ATP-dependent zinc metalloprotease FtsH [Calditrichota bacterium]RQW00948.1 MAG: ATP-dependent metallopeptidase FtsH/Yme1/Tma family protein [Calditrichota bacterium]